jgi:hypothetical protein
VPTEGRQPIGEANFTLQVTPMDAAFCSMMESVLLEVL